MNADQILADLDRASFAWIREFTRHAANVDKAKELSDKMIEAAQGYNAVDVIVAAAVICQSVLAHTVEEMVKAHEKLQKQNQPSSWPVTGSKAVN